MRHLAAYLLLQVGGNASPSAADVKKVLSAVGIEADEDRLSTLISELEGKDVAALITEGAGKLASVPAGGTVAASGCVAAVGSAAAAYAPQEAEAAEE